VRGGRAGDSTPGSISNTIESILNDLVRQRIARHGTRGRISARNVLDAVPSHISGGRIAGRPFASGAAFAVRAANLGSSLSVASGDAEDGSWK
jgi:hypothetical protein